MILIEKIMILSVLESKGEIFDKVLDVVRQSGISDITEVSCSIALLPREETRKALLEAYQCDRLFFILGICI